MSSSIELVGGNVVPGIAVRKYVHIDCYPRARLFLETHDPVIVGRIDGVDNDIPWETRIRWMKTKKNWLQRKRKLPYRRMYILSYA